MSQRWEMREGREMMGEKRKEIYEVKKRKNENANCSISRIGTLYNAADVSGAC
jgi:hypothetical protein